MALLRPYAEWPKLLIPCSASSPADPKIVSEDTNKCQSLNSLLVLYRVAAIFPERFHCFTVALRNSLLY
jgi:hypothetical protein